MAMCTKLNAKWQVSREYMIRSKAACEQWCDCPVATSLDNIHTGMQGNYF